MPATFTQAIAVMRVKSITAAEDFYCRQLGFTRIAAWRPDENFPDPCYMTVTRGNARLHVHSFPGGAPGPSQAYVFVDDVASLYQELLEKGVAVPHPPMDQDWRMREIGVRDADQNILTFGQVLTAGTAGG